MTKRFLMSIVILTEKPSAARNFAKALGGNSGTFDGEDYKIVHSAGHLYEFPKEVEKLTKGKEDFYKVWAWKNLPWDPADFNWNKRMIKGSGGLVEDIRAGLKGATEVVIATNAAALSAPFIRFAANESMLFGLPEGV